MVAYTNSPILNVHEVHITDLVKLLISDGIGQTGLVKLFKNAFFHKNEFQFKMVGAGIVGTLRVLEAVFTEYDKQIAAATKKTK